MTFRHRALALAPLATLLVLAPAGDARAWCRDAIVQTDRTFVDARATAADALGADMYLERAPRGAGTLRVVVYGSADLDASRIRPASLRLQTVGATPASPETRPARRLRVVRDLNGDGFRDARATFKLPLDERIAAGHTDALLSGTTRGGGAQAFEAVAPLPGVAHGLGCAAMMASITPGPGYGVPGDGGAPRFGMPVGPAPRVRVRRSWTSLTAAEQREVMDAFVALKNRTVDDAGAAGAGRADYTSFCDGSYTRNLYDYYVEAHLSAFISVNTPDMTMTEHPHMGPQFLPWHRYLLLRIEADMRDVTGNPDFALPYWNWADCESTTGGGTNTCPRVFQEDSLGSAGTCGSDDTVTGYLVDEGFHLNVYANGAPNLYSATTVVCEEKALERSVGCSGLNQGQPPSAEDEAGIYSRPQYDVPPYDSCGSDETVSVRQYIEGYTRRDVNPSCILGGCQMHGLGHFFVGGDMAATSAPNDPIFFMHHANVDRLWADWQERHRQRPETAGDYGNPGYPDAWRGPIFNFDRVRADEMFDFRALGYRYDTQQPRADR